MQVGLEPATRLGFHVKFCTMALVQSIVAKTFWGYNVLAQPDPPPPNVSRANTCWVITAAIEI